MPPLCLVMVAPDSKPQNSSLAAYSCVLEAIPMTRLLLSSEEALHESRLAEWSWWALGQAVLDAHVLREGCTASWKSDPFSSTLVRRGHEEVGTPRAPGSCENRPRIINPSHIKKGGPEQHAFRRTRMRSRQPREAKGWHAPPDLAGVTGTQKSSLVWKAWHPAAVQPSLAALASLILVPHELTQGLNKTRSI